jgi:uncharacterized membrane-anchored protein
MTSTVDVNEGDTLKATTTMRVEDDERDEDEELGDVNKEAPGPHHQLMLTAVEEGILKLPHLTVIYWCEKMTATTFGETFSDYFSQTLDFGYGTTSAVFISIFAVTLACQLYVTTYWPVIFWTVMATSSIAGTLISDFIDRTLGWGYPLGTSSHIFLVRRTPPQAVLSYLVSLISPGMGVLLGILLFLIGSWKLTGLPMNVEGAMTRQAEALYWSCILVSNTLGTALGDFIADSLELGFGMTAGIVGGLLAICALLAYFTKVSRVVLFWVAFILTRPFGASFGDFLTKSSEKGGLDLGTLNASMVILGLFLICFAIEMYGVHKVKVHALLEKYGIYKPKAAAAE